MTYGQRTRIDIIARCDERLIGSTIVTMVYLTEKSISRDSERVVAQVRRV